VGDRGAHTLIFYDAPIHAGTISDLPRGNFAIVSSVVTFKG
jgi:hypothetical protein